MSEMKVQTFKASPAMIGLIDELVKSTKTSKSVVIRAAIVKLYGETVEGGIPVSEFVALGE